MRSRVPASGTLAAVVSIVVALVILVGCVPEPANRATPAGGAAAVRIRGFSPSMALELRLAQAAR